MCGESHKSGNPQVTSLTLCDYMKLAKSLSDKVLFIISNDIHDDVSILVGLCVKKTNNLGFRPSLTQTRLPMHRRWLEDGTFGFRKFVCFLFGFKVAFNIICHITTVSGCERELNAHFYSAASLWYQIPDTFTWYHIQSHYTDTGATSPSPTPKI